MQIFVVGMNHNSAPIALRERFAFAGSALDKGLESLRNIPQFHESLLLSTCNRTEVYGVSDISPTYKDWVVGLFSQEKGAPAEEFQSCLYDRTGKDAVEHLLGVVCGLDSMILGENEILGQVKKAYEKASLGKNTGKILHRLLQRSFHVGKAVRSAYGNSYGDISVSSVAVDLAKKIFNELAACKVMIVGTGPMGEQTVHHLRKEGVRSIVASNRSFDRAVEMARSFAGEAVTLEGALEKMAEVDIVISATACPHALFTRDQVQQRMPRRRGKPIFFIDIAVPRDIDPRVNELENVFLYNIDDLQKIHEQKSRQRDIYVEQSRISIAREMEKISAWFAASPGTPRIEMQGRIERPECFAALKAPRHDF